METIIKSEENHELHLNTSSEAYQAVRGAAADAFNNQSTALGCLWFYNQGELLNKIQGIFSLDQGHTQSDEEDIEKQTVFTAQEILDEISKKAGEKEVEELIPELIKQIKDAKTEEDEERILGEMKK